MKNLINRALVAEKKLFILFIPILLGLTACAGVTSGGIEFTTFRDTSYYDPEWGDEEALIGVSYVEIQWPMSGKSNSELHIMRECLLRMLVSDSVFMLLTDSVDNPDFITTLYDKSSDRDVDLPSPHRIGDDGLIEISEESLLLKREKDDLYVFGFYSSLYQDGMPRPVEGCRMINYDISRNRQLNLGDILDNTKSAEIDSALVELVYQWQKENDEFLGTKWSPKQSLDFKDTSWWYIDENGIVIIFSPYEIACGLKGHVGITIPVNKYQHLFRQDALKYWK